MIKDCAGGVRKEGVYDSSWRKRRNRGKKKKIYIEKRET